MRESFDALRALGSPVAKPEPVLAAEETEVPGCASAGQLVVPKTEVTPDGDGEEPGGTEHGGSEWLVRTVKVEKEEEEEEEWGVGPSTDALLAWHPPMGALPPAASAPGCASARTAEPPCPQELAYGGVPTGHGACGCCFPAAPPRPFACAQCGKGFGKKAHLTRHLRVHTGERPFPCPDCGRRFRQKIHLRAHQQTHTGERPFPCPDCGRRFRKKTHLARHRLTHTGERPFPCARCARRFAHKQHLLRHQQLHAAAAPAAPEVPPACPECGRWKKDLVCHHDAVPPARAFGDAWHPSAHPHAEPCAHCAHPHLLRHLRAHPDAHPDPLAGARPPAGGTRPFACQLCGRSFGRKSHLARHQGTVHAGTRPHACAQCGKRFGSKTNLARHEAVHTGHRPYACARCAKAFSRKTHLLRHQRTHPAAATDDTDATDATVPQQSWPLPPAPVPAAVCP